MQLDPQRIQFLIARGETDIALDELINYLNHSDHQKLEEAISLSARLSQSERLSRHNLISFGEKKLELNQINIALLELLKELKELNDSQELNLPFQSSKISILFLTATPSDEDTIRSIAEINNIEEELKKSKHRDKFVITRKDGAGINELLDGLFEQSPNIVHFSGHGSVDGIKLVDKNNESQIVPNKALANLFSEFSDSLACVFLNSCFSQIQGELISQNINNVIGMSAAVPDDLAMQFSTTFYKALGAGKEIDFAFRIAKISTDLSDLDSSHLPVILKKDSL